MIWYEGRCNVKFKFTLRDFSKKYFAKVDLQTYTLSLVSTIVHNTVQSVQAVMSSQFSLKHPVVDLDESMK